MRRKKRKILTKSDNFEIFCDSINLDYNYNQPLLCVLCSSFDNTSNLLSFYFIFFFFSAKEIRKKKTRHCVANFFSCTSLTPTCLNGKIYNVQITNLPFLKTHMDI